MHSTLTRYTPGSFREVWTLAWPLMLSFLSLGIMIFTDRLFLAVLGHETLNACVTAGMSYWLLIIIPVAISGVSEVVIGRYNGAHNYPKMGAVFSTSLIFSLALLPYSWLIAWQPQLAMITSTNDLEISYLRMLAFFIPFQVLSNALTGCFVGMGRVRIIVVSTLLGAIVNVVLDWWLIFGGWGVEPLGITGAALGTGLAQLAQSLFFLVLAWSPSMHSKYGTRHFRKHLNAMFSLLKEFIGLGLPVGFAQFIEVLGHLAFLRLTQKMGSDHMMLTSLAQSLLFLLLFVGMAANKTAATICANAVGSGQFHLLSKTIRNCMSLVGLCALIFFTLTSLNANWLLGAFLNNEDFTRLLQDPYLMQNAHLTFFALSLFFLFDNTNWVMHGVLTAKSDTRILMFVNILTYWGLVVAPLAWMVHHGFQGAYLGWFLLAFSTFSATSFYLVRHYRNPIPSKVFVDKPL